MNSYRIEAKNVELWIRDGRVTFEPQDGAETHRGAFAIAGLVDCHSHSTFDLSDRGLTPGTSEVVAANMHDYFAAGVTASGTPVASVWLRSRRAGRA